MRPLTLSDLVALASGQVLALVAACASISGVWHWLAAAHPLR